MNRDRFWITRVHQNEGYEVLDMLDKRTATACSVYRVKRHYLDMAGRGLSTEVRLEVSAAVDDYNARAAAGIPHEPPADYTERVEITPPKRGLFARLFG